MLDLYGMPPWANFTIRHSAGCDPIRKKFFFQRHAVMTAKNCIFIKISSKKCVCRSNFDKKKVFAVIPACRKKKIFPDRIYRAYMPANFTYTGMAYRSSIYVNIFLKTLKCSFQNLK